MCQAFENIAQHKLDDQQLSLLVPMHQRGARETKKQRLKRLLKLQRAGVQLPEGFSGDTGRKRSKRPAELLRERKRARQEGSDSEAAATSSDSDSDASGAVTEEEEEAAAQLPQAAVAATPKQSAGAVATPAAAQAVPGQVSAEEAARQQQEQLRRAREEARRVKQQLGIAGGQYPVTHCRTYCRTYRSRKTCICPCAQHSQQQVQAGAGCWLALLWVRVCIPRTLFWQ
jgi:ATP-dependent RNA helicase DHX37/DHR1